MRLSLTPSHDDHRGRHPPANTHAEVSRILLYPFSGFITCVTCWGSGSGLVGFVPMFFGLPDPDPLVRDPDQDPSIIK